MEQDSNTWVLVLAAGDGTRLRSLTTIHSGTSIPKQFCSLRGGASLFQEALARGRRVCLPQYLCTVVAARHQTWWYQAAAVLQQQNVIIQPKNLGTAIGILLPLLQIIERDRDARIVLLPADHHVEDEAVLTESMRHALTCLTPHTDEIVLLGIEPDEPDTELGYIVPRHGNAQWGLRIDKFIEKPDRKTALALLDAGALWNSFIIAGHAQAILKMYAQRYPELVSEMQYLVRLQRQPAQSSLNLIDLYSRLPTLDFSRHILERQESHLRVVPVPHCGWTDLGTPKRVSEVLRKSAYDQGSQSTNGYLNLAMQHARLLAAGQITG